MPPYTRSHTQSMHFRQGANGKINYQQAKALALHFYCREKRPREGLDGMKEGGPKTAKEKGKGDERGRQATVRGGTTRG